MKQLEITWKDGGERRQKEKEEDLERDKQIREAKINGRIVALFHEEVPVPIPGHM